MPGAGDRIRVGVRLALITATLVGAVGAGGELLGWPLLTSTIGPTVYTFAAHPVTPAARARNALLGHSAAVGAGLLALAAFGLWQHPAASAARRLDGRQLAATVVAVTLTLLVLQVGDSHHAPAAATTILITTGLARPGRPLLGLIIGLAVVLALAPALSRLPLYRDQTRQQQ